MTFHAYAAREAGGPFEPFEYDPGELPADHLDIAVESCGICHSDLSMRDNEWHMTQYPFVGGHEVVGRVAAAGEHVPNVQVGDRVGLGWFTRSCMHCLQCLGGYHNRCPQSEMTIVGRHGGFADQVRCHWGWATPLPDALDATKAEPLFCGGITVFNPFVQHDIQPTDRVGVIGIGGLGHLALMFADKWGCEVTAFSTSAAKEDEARQLGADEFVNLKDPGALEKQAGKFDLILNTANAALDWDAFLNALAPGGVLHTVGVVSNTFGGQVFPLLLGQRSLSGSPVGPPATVMRMIEFAARHDIAPVTEHYKLANINDAFEKLRSGSARYRLVLDAN